MKNEPRYTKQEAGERGCQMKLKKLGGARRGGEVHLASGRGE